MIDGIYRVVSWNGTDGHLVNDKDEMITLSKQELPFDFHGFLILDEKVEFKAGTIVSLMNHSRWRYKEPKRVLVMSPRAAEIMQREAERRTQYGADRGLVKA